MFLGVQRPKVKPPYQVLLMTCSNLLELDGESATFIPRPSCWPARFPLLLALRAPSSIDRIACLVGMSLEGMMATCHMARALWLTLQSLLKIARSTSRFGQFRGLSGSTWWTICHLPLEVPPLFCFPAWSSSLMLLFYLKHLNIWGNFALASQWLGQDVLGLLECIPIKAL